MLQVLAFACAVGGAPLAAAAADTVDHRYRTMDGMAEVEHARLAAQNATRDEVKPFGQRV